MFGTTALTLAVALIALVASLGLRERSRPSEEHVARVAIDAKPACLGTLIAPSWVLTAKHCVQEVTENSPLAPERIRVSLGAQASLTSLQVDAVFVRGTRYQSLGELMGRDLALLKLARRAARAGAPHQTRPAEWTNGMPSVNARSLFAVLATAPGRQTPLELRKVESSSLFVEGRTSPGDSGGPLYDEERNLVGVASVRSLGGRGEGVSVYTRVDVHRDWIRSTIGGS